MEMARSRGCRVVVFVVVGEKEKERAGANTHARSLDHSSFTLATTTTNGNTTTTTLPPNTHTTHTTTQVNFPRTPRIRKRWLLRRVAELLIFTGLFLFIINQYVTPTVQVRLRLSLSLRVWVEWTRLGSVCALAHGCGRARSFLTVRFVVKTHTITPTSLQHHLINNNNTNDNT